MDRSQATCHLPPATCHLPPATCLARYLNVREMMHLMGLPHDFTIDAARNINHIAQNVPTCTARDYAEQVTPSRDLAANMTLNMNSNIIMLRIEHDPEK